MDADMIAYRIEFLAECGGVLAWETEGADDPGTAEARARLRAGIVRRAIESNGYAPEVKGVRLVDPDGREHELRQRRRRRKY
jgi:hypothetical protein